MPNPTDNLKVGEQLAKQPNRTISLKIEKTLTYHRHLLLSVPPAVSEKQLADALYLAEKRSQGGGGIDFELQLQSALSELPGAEIVQFGTQNFMAPDSGTVEIEDINIDGAKYEES